MFYDRDSETCEMCPQGTYQDQLAQFECTSCGDNFTTITIRSVSQQDCIGKYSDFWVLENVRPVRCVYKVPIRKSLHSLNVHGVMMASQPSPLEVSHGRIVLVSAGPCSAVSSTSDGEVRGIRFDTWARLFKASLA